MPLLPDEPRDVRSSRACAAGVRDAVRFGRRDDLDDRNDLDLLGTDDFLVRTGVEDEDGEVFLPLPLPLPSTVPTVPADRNSRAFPASPASASLAARSLLFASGTE